LTKQFVLSNSKCLDHF